MRRLSFRPVLSLSLLVLALVAGPAAAQAPVPDGTPGARAEALAAEAVRRWDRKDYQGAEEAFREALAAAPSAATYRDLGDLYAERDRHPEAVAAYRSAIALDASLEPDLRQPLGEQLLWADRVAEAVPLLESVVAGRPRNVEAKRHLALAYRWSDRLPEAERLYREILADDPGDVDARKGLGETLLWQGRHEAASAELARVLERNPADVETLVALSRARLFLDLPEEAAAYADRAAALAPENREVRDQVARLRERLARHAAILAAGSNDSEDLSIYEFALSAGGRPLRGLSLEGSARQVFFRQGSPGKANNIDDEDSVDGTGGALAATYRSSPGTEWRAGAGLVRYDVADFHPWSGTFGVTISPTDTTRLSAGWERSHFDSILSLQNRVTADTFTVAASKHVLWKTEVAAEGSYIVHRNDNRTGQDRDNRGGRVGLALSRRLFLKGDDAYVAGIVRLRWLGFENDELDVGVFNPGRYTTEEAGADFRFRLRPQWELHGTAFGGAQQENGHSGGFTYEADIGLDRKVGLGLVGIGGFASDSNARGRGEGFRRYGGLVRFVIPF